MPRAASISCASSARGFERVRQATGSPVTDRPSAAARLWDAAALALVAGGAALYLSAHTGMKGILASQVHLATIEAPNITRWVHYRTMSNLGLALVVLGVGVGIAAYYRSRRPSTQGAAGLPAGGGVPDGPSQDTPNAPQ